ncbi:MAG: hypothetical protein HY706_07455, partial [Candidatus Hydrogenedentes bacterium]|nr:hypothetical protein [Candidatus Hydrogenedentota bacterium]
AQDRAGNVTQDSMLLDPLHLWWLLDVRTRITPNREGQTVEFPQFTWDLGRTFAPPATGQPKPIFTYRLWSADNYDGPYTPLATLPNWAPWSSQNVLGYDSFFVALNIINDFAGKWLLLVVAGGDEAGNMEPWPINDLALGAGDQVMVNAGATSGTNWQRFMVSSTQAPDTVVAPMFWHNNLGAPVGDTTPNPDEFIEDIAPTNFGELRFGAAKIIPLPPLALNQRVEAQFQIDLLGNFTGTAQVHWELLRDGSRILEGITGPAVGTVSLTLPGQANFLFGDEPARRVAVNYVFRAWTEVDTDNDSIFEARDPTPANVYFTVVPDTDAGKYINPKNTLDAQPVKTKEEL